MKLWIAYAVFDGTLGARILGALPNYTAAMERCKTFHEHEHPELQHFDGAGKGWTYFKDNGIYGWQSVIENVVCYYVEEHEIDTTQDFTDELLRQIAMNGNLAQQCVEAHAYVQPLEERQIRLEAYIDHLLDKLGLTELEFVVDGVTELWVKGEKRQ